MDHNEAHRKALAETGFWGAQGAGTMIFSRKTKRFLVPLRAAVVREPLTWGVWSGAIDGDEDPKAAVIRETFEESGYTGEAEVFKIYEFRSGTFVFHNFISIVDDEFEPTLNWENERAEWFLLQDFPEPMHFGLKAVLADPEARKIIDDLIAQ